MIKTATAFTKAWASRGCGPTSNQMPLRWWSPKAQPYRPEIKELARWHEIPIVENPPLAQALYKAAEVGQMIPPQLYAAVAEILAFCIALRSAWIRKVLLHNRVPRARKPHGH